MICSMKITHEVREYAAKMNVDESLAVEEGMKEKSQEFKAKGSTIYQKT